MIALLTEKLISIENRETLIIQIKSPILQSPIECLNLCSRLVRLVEGCAHEKMEASADFDTSLALKKISSATS